MSSNLSKEPERSSSKTPSGAGSSVKGKRQPKNDDWSEVTDPEERRRIQNRIAQRKFRERNRESKEHAQRAERNRIHASSSYRIPTPSDLGPENEVSGLPWGSINIGHVVSRGLDNAASRRSSSQTGRPSTTEAEASARSIFGSVSPVPSALSSYPPPPERAPTSVPCSSASTSPGQASQAQTQAQSQPQEGYHQSALRPSGLIPISAPTPQSTGADQFSMPWFQDVVELVYQASENQNQERNRNQDQ